MKNYVITIARENGSNGRAIGEPGHPFLQSGYPAHGRR